MERLQDSRVWIVGGVLVALVILAVGWLAFIGPQRSSARDLRDQAAATAQQNELLQSTADSLKAKSKRLPQLTSSLRRALAALPYDSALPTFTRQIDAQARANDVSISSVVIGGVSPVTAPAAPASTAPGITTTKPASGAVYSMQVTVQSDGSLGGQLAFVNAMRVAGPRRALVTSMQVTPGLRSRSSSIAGGASITTQLSIFSALQTPGQIQRLNKLLRGDLGD